MNEGTFRVVTRGADGEIRTRDYDTAEALLKRHSQVGVDDCSTDLNLRGLPVFDGLIGPMPEGKTVVRYESPEVFETLTKEWSATGPRGGGREARPSARHAGRKIHGKGRRLGKRNESRQVPMVMNLGLAILHAQPLHL